MASALVVEEGGIHCHAAILARELGIPAVVSVVDALARIPAGRWAEPQDIAGAAVFLASPAARYVHGAVLNVDGGWMAR